jgi:hypothetical protein
LSCTTIGGIAAKTAGEIAGKLADNPDIRNAFQKAKGDTEFYADGTFVHIRSDENKAEWREMKVGAFAKRERGERATPSEWNTRKLPQPTAVSAFAALVDKEEFQERCHSMRRRLGVGGISSALGDGAKWIWNTVWEVFGKTEECLDIYHGAGVESIEGAFDGEAGRGGCFVAGVPSAQCGAVELSGAFGIGSSDWEWLD